MPSRNPAPAITHTCASTKSGPLRRSGNTAPACLKTLPGARVGVGGSKAYALQKARAESKCNEYCGTMGMARLSRRLDAGHSCAQHRLAHSHAVQEVKMTYHNYLFLAFFLLGISYIWSIAFHDALLILLFALFLFKAHRSWTWMEQVKVPIILSGSSIAWKASSIMWALDSKMALHKSARLWPWIAFTGMASLIAKNAAFLRTFFWGGILGLTINLGLCFVQWLQLIPIGNTILWGMVRLPVPSQPRDPTGIMDHIWFGLVYGCFAFWGIAILTSSKLREIYNIEKNKAFFLITFFIISCVFTFIAKGRSGYLIWIALSIFFVFRYPKVALPFLSSALFISSFIIFTLPGTWQRVQSIVADYQAIEHSRSQKPARILLWKAAVEMWRESPLVGIGIGSYEAGLHELKKNGKIDITYIGQDHAHNQYLSDLAATGIIGTTLMCLMLIGWGV
ncbi:MAG: O-antigen ligase domain-containing protein, partial [Zetaproteobacteria bacterium]